MTIASTGVITNHINFPFFIVSVHYLSSSLHYLAPMHLPAEEEEKSPEQGASNHTEEQTMKPPTYPPPSSQSKNKEKAREDSLDKSAFGVLPEEVIDMILGFLQALELSRIGMTCRRMKHRSSSSKLWRRLFLIDFHVSSCAVEIPPPPPPNNNLQLGNAANRSFHNVPPPTPIPPTNVLPSSLTSIDSLVSLPHLQNDLRSAKLSYAKRMKDFEDRKNQRAQERLRQLERTKRLKRRRTIARILELFSFRYILPLFGVCSLASLGLITVALNTGSNIYQIFIPLWVFFSICLISIVIGTTLYRKRNDSSSILQGLWEGHLSFSSLWMNELASPFEGKKKKIVIISGFILFLFLFVFVLLVNLKLSSFNFTWVETFIPFWLIFLTVCLLILPPMNSLSNSTFSEKLEFAISFVTILLPLIVFSIVLPLYLDGIIISTLEIIFIPLWFQDAVYVLAVGIYSIASGLNDMKELRSNIFYMIILWIIIAPIIIFQGLLCQYVKNPSSISSPALFSPLFVWFSIYTLFALIGMCAVEDSFEDVLQQQQQQTSPQHHHRSSSSPLLRSHSFRDLQFIGDVASHSSSSSPTAVATIVAGDRYHNHREPFLLQSNNPQFTGGGNHNNNSNAVLDPDLQNIFWDHIMSQFGDNDPLDEFQTVSDFHRMQLALSRAFSDMTHLTPHHHHNRYSSFNQQMRDQHLVFEPPPSPPPFEPPPIPPAFLLSATRSSSPPPPTPPLPPLSEENDRDTEEEKIDKDELDLV